MQVIKNSIGIVFLCFSNLLAAQTLRGTVKESVTGNAIAGATMTLESDQKGEKKTISSDEQGVFRFDNLQPGYYQILVEHVGHQKITIKELLVTSGKERVLNLLLDLGTTPIPVIEVVEARYDHKMQPLGEIPLSRDQTLRYPMTYYDPARLATAFAGVAQTDDGTNSISVRGNNPGLLRWRLEGVDIVSPNHLSNAGTLSDRPAISSGGVLMLSAQMLDNTSLLTSNYSAQYGDAIGGIMDMHLRKGNNQQAEQTIQVGLVGLDATLEGPFSKRKRGSYLINYRYSTVGLLGVLAVKRLIFRILP
jgi:Carboxypeptidase regulatory-like domain